MNFKLAVSALILGSVVAFVPGCAADAVADDADAEEAGTSSDELSAYASKFVGAYHGSDGSGGPPSIEGLVFRVDGTFFGDVDTGIRCFRAPCPSNVHLEGRYSATKNYLRLTAKAGTPASNYYGRYKYSWAAGDTVAFSLSRSDFNPGWSNQLDRKISYCGQPSDCGGQGLITPACVGSFTCGETEANSCGFQCGVVADPIWPATATKLVAESPGGGFVPPAPAGSTCAVGHQKYTLNRSTRGLTWETCEWTGSATPLHLKTGSATITLKELAAVNAAMDAVTIATEDMCGADKPLYQIKGTTPAGVKTYTDSFYKCQGGSRTYVDNINEVFNALRAAAN